MSIFRRKTKVEPRVLRIPEDRVRDILELFDDAEKERSRVAKYDLWDEISNIFPEVTIGHWTLEAHALSIIVREEMDE